MKSNTFINLILEALSDNIEGTFPSSLISACHHITECHEDEFVLATGDSDIPFLVKYLPLKLQV